MTRRTGIVIGLIVLTSILVAVFLSAFSGQQTTAEKQGPATRAEPVEAGRGTPAAPSDRRARMFVGRVVRGFDLAPVEGARISIVGETGRERRSIESDEHGRFDAPRINGRVDVEKTGFQSKSVRIPPTGQALVVVLERVCKLHISVMDSHEEPAAAQVSVRESITGKALNVVPRSPGAYDATNILAGISYDIIVDSPGSTKFELKGHVQYSDHALTIQLRAQIRLTGRAEFQDSKEPLPNRSRVNFSPAGQVYRRQTPAVGTVQDGDYVVTVNDSGTFRVSATLPGGEIVGAGTIQIDPHIQLLRMDLSFESPPRGNALLIRDVHGEPITTALVSVSRPDGQMYPRRWRADAEGKVEFPGTRECLARIEAPGFKPVEYALHRLLDHGHVIILEEAANGTLLVDTARADASADVAYRRLDGVRTTLGIPPESEWTAFVSDDDGVISVGQIPEGSYLLAVRAQSSISSWIPFQISRGDVSVVSAVLQPAAKLSGHVRMAHGVPVGDSRVDLCGPSLRSGHMGRLLERTRSTADGEFEFESVLREGEYSVVATHREWNTNQPVELHESDMGSAVRLQIEIDGNGRSLIRGVLYGADGASAAGKEVECLQQYGGRVRETTTRADGGFEFHVSPGLYNVSSCGGVVVVRARENAIHEIELRPSSGVVVLGSLRTVPRGEDGTVAFLSLGDSVLRTTQVRDSKFEARLLPGLHFFTVYGISQPYWGMLEIPDSESSAVSLTPGNGRVTWDVKTPLEARGGTVRASLELVECQSIDFVSRYGMTLFDTAKHIAIPGSGSFTGPRDGLYRLVLTTAAGNTKHETLRIEGESTTALGEIMVE